MQTQPQPRFRTMRRILFPYSGEEVLSLSQGLRVVLSWAVFFAFIMMLLTSPIILCVAASSLSRLLLLLLLSFLTGAVVFGTLGLLVVSMGNRAARIRQQRRAATQTNGTNGGRYGS